MRACPHGALRPLPKQWADFRIGSLKRQVNLGRLPKDFHESDDPNRLVPIVLEPDDFMVLVSGDPLRTNAYAFAHNGYLGFPAAKKIRLADRLGGTAAQDPEVATAPLYRFTRARSALLISERVERHNRHEPAFHA